MPFTPFHFGPGLAIKSVATRHFSWLAFVVVQVVIDVETLYYLVQRAYPIHRHLHTFIGATLTGILVGCLLILIRLSAEKLSQKIKNYFHQLSPPLSAEISNAGLLLGALLGGCTHPLLDGIMHSDIHPFLPWTSQNPLLKLIPIDLLHMTCLFLGILGFFLLILKYLLPKSKRAMPEI